MKKMVLALPVLVVLGVALWLALSGQESNMAACADRSPAPAVVAFGDSLVSGFGVSASENAFSVLSGIVGVPIENLGVSGDTTATARARISGVLARAPDIVIVLVGGNDALMKTSVVETEENLSAIVTEIKAAGAAAVLVGVIGGFPTDPYASMFERLAEEHDVPFVPNILSGLIGRDEFMSDPIHPNAAGHARMAERLAPALERACASS
ncbi:MAG: GDSL-type esterase/lipase family protein [Patescibacteria group bacterium]